MARLATPEDEEREASVLVAVSQRFKALGYRFAPLDPLDFYLVRDDTTLAVGEIKVRNKRTDELPEPTVYLSVRKWLALNMAHIGLGVVPLFVAAFKDGIYWIDVREISDHQPKRKGRYDRGLERDKEPIIEVPIADMKVINV